MTDTNKWYSILITGRSYSLGLYLVRMEHVDAVSEAEAIGKGIKIAKENYPKYHDIKVEALVCP